MSEYRRSRPPRRRRRPWRKVLAAVAVVVVFLAGIGLGQALDDNSPPGGTQTLVRTLGPLPLVPVTGTAGTTSSTNPTSNP